MNDITSPDPAARESRLPLVACAIVLLVLVAVRLGAVMTPAHASEAAGGAGADVVSRVGDYTILTLGADNDDVLVVLDGRNESLSAYRIKNKNSLDLVESIELKAIFAEGRRIGSGK
ncbi:MAG: hypothetical protein AB7G11_02870 [Phycisphaerales bacterium]